LEPANILFTVFVESLPEKVIQSTHGLLFAASVQALEQRGPGINTIDPKDDEWVFKRAVRELSAMPELR
jgi:hypothetical protein